MYRSPFYFTFFVSVNLSWVRNTCQQSKYKWNTNSGKSHLKFAAGAPLPLWREANLMLVKESRVRGRELKGTEAIAKI